MKRAVKQQIDRSRIVAAIGKRFGESPIPGISPIAWGKFLSVMRSDTHSINRLGIYSLSYPQLQDIGLVRNVSKKGGTWHGEWLPPHTLESFLSDEKAQQAHFESLVKLYLPSISECVGTMIGDTYASLSGLLAVACCASLGGLAGWLEGKRLPHTTKMFEAANGIF